jgi:DNA-binding CsgD family transcriptional regulator
MITKKAYRDVTSQIFAAALDPSAWGTALGSVARLIPGAKLHIFAHDIEARRNLGLINSGHEDVWIKRYIDHYAALNPYPQFADEFRYGEVRTLESTLPHEEIRDTEYYNDWIKPQGDLITGTGMVLSNEPASLCVVGTLQPRRHADRLDALAMSVMKELSPIFLQAWRLCGTTAARAFDRGEVIEEISGEIVLAVDASHRLIHANGAAEQALQKGDWVTVDANGRVRLSEPEADMQLAFMLRAIDRDEAVSPAWRLLRDRDRMANVDLLPMSPDGIADTAAAMRLGLFRPAVMICIAPQKKRARPSWDEEYGLTEAETAVARYLALGHSLEDIAELREVSLHTIRNQIKSAMSKCGVSRQSQLVARILRNE